MNDGVPLSRATRARVMLSAHVFGVDRSEATQHRVTNISETGVCITQAGELAAGAVVVMTIGGVEHVAADVVWRRGELAGLAFRAPINVSDTRRSPAHGRTVTPPASGWLAELNSPYRK